MDVWNGPIIIMMICTIMLQQQHIIWIQMLMEPITPLQLLVGMIPIRKQTLAAMQHLKMMVHGL